MAVRVRWDIRQAEGGEESPVLILAIRRFRASNFDFRSCVFPAICVIGVICG